MGGGPRRTTSPAAFASAYDVALEGITSADIAAGEVSEKLSTQLADPNRALVMAIRDFLDTPTFDDLSRAGRASGVPAAGGGPTPCQSLAWALTTI